MKFKHTFNVFVDNFSVTYKQLLYRLIIGAISAIILVLGLSPFVKSFIPELNRLFDSVKDFTLNLLNGNTEDLHTFRDSVVAEYNALTALVNKKTTQFVLSGFLFLLVYTVASWFSALGNYAAASVINDKMAMRTEAPFLVTLIRNLKNACIYGAVYVPLSLVWDILVAVAMFFFIFYLLNSFIPLFICVFMFVAVMVFAITIKMTFTSDLLPAMIRGKLGIGAALKYTFSQKGKSTFNVLSNYVILVLIIFGLNVACTACTLGVGALITVPASYVILSSFQMVNYYDREEIKYSVDNNTIIKPAREHTPTREEFFRGEDD